MKIKKASKLVLTSSIAVMLMLLGLYVSNVHASGINLIKLTLAGTADTTSTDVISAYNSNSEVLDVIAVINSSTQNPIYEVNVPKYLIINKYTLPADSNGKLQKVEIIDKDTGNVLPGDNCAKDRILRFTLTPGTLGPTGFTVEVGAYGYYVLPNEEFILYAQYFDGTNLLSKSEDFTLKARNFIYQVLIDGGIGNLEQGKLAKYSVRVQSGGSYSWPVYAPDIAVKIPLPDGVQFVSGESGVTYVPASGKQPHYLLINQWATQISWIQWCKFTLYYPSAKPGDTFTGQPITMTYTHGGRVEQTITQQNGIYNKIVGGSGLYTDLRLRSWTYMIGADASPFLNMDFFNNLGQDLTNVNYDITIPDELKIRGLNVYATNLNKTIYANITFKTSSGNTIVKKVDTGTICLNPSVLGLGDAEWITSININLPKVPKEFMLYKIADGGPDHYFGFVFYGTTADRVNNGTKAKITVEEHSDQEKKKFESESTATLRNDVPAQMSVDWNPAAKTVVAGQKITLSRYLYAAGYPYGGTSYHTIVNPTLYYFIPSGFSVNPNEVVLSGKFINKKPNITWSTGVVPSSAYFPDGAGVLKIEFDGLTPDRSVTLRGLDDNCRYITEGANVQFLVQALESTKIATYNFNPYLLMEAQNTKVGCGWGVSNWRDIYDTNGNGDEKEIMAYTNLDAVGYPNYGVTVTDPLKVDVKSTASSRLTGVDNTVELFPSDIATYSLEIRNRLNKNATDTVAYIPIPQKSDNITDRDGNNYTHAWTAQLDSVDYVEDLQSGGDPAENIEIWYSTSNIASKNELHGGQDSGYTKYNGGSLPSEVKMVKVKIGQLPKQASVKFNLGIKASSSVLQPEALDYMVADYRFLYDGVETKTKTSIKTLKLMAYRVSGKVFEDINRNGAQDVGEPLLKDVEISLLDNGGNLIKKMPSTAEGTYEFIINSQGSYKIKAYNADSGISFTTPNSSAQGSKVDQSGEYLLVIDGNTTKDIAGIHIGYVISWHFESSEPNITLPHKNFKYIQLRKLPFNALLRNGEELYFEDPSIAAVEWDDSTQDPFDIKVTGEKVGTTNLIIRFQSGYEGIKEQKIPITVTNVAPGAPTIVAAICDYPGGVRLIAKAVDQDDPQKVKFEWERRLVGTQQWIASGTSDFGDSDTEVTNTADFKKTGLYQVRCRTIDEAEATSGWVTSSGPVNIWYPEVSDFSDLVTAKNNWISKTDGGTENRKYNWYSAKSDGEIVTRITIKDSSSAGYDKIVLDYDLNSDNNNEIDIDPDSIQVAGFIDVDAFTQLNNITYSMDVSNNDKMKLTLNSLPLNKNVAIYVKYKVKMKNAETKLQNELLNNNVSLTVNKNSHDYKVKQVSLYWPINLTGVKAEMK